MQNVEEPVEAQEQHDVGSDVLDVLALRDHVQLRQDSPRLQPNRKRLENAIDRKRFVEEEGEDGGGEVKRPVREGVRFCVVALDNEGATMR